jgi:TetR/AcrR family transcriptional regulator, cholesterol catabolism regulator
MTTLSTPPDAISRTTRQIMKAVAPLFAERGYGAVGTAEICAVSGYGKGALYHHIGSKETLLYNIMTVYMRDLLEDAAAVVATIADTEARVQALSLGLMQAVIQTNAEMTVCFREVHALSPDKRRDVLRLHGDYYRLWERVANEARDAGVFRAVDSDELKGLLGMYFYSFLWVSSARVGDIEALAAKFAGIVLRACRAS